MFKRLEQKIVKEEEHQKDLEYAFTKGIKETAEENKNFCCLLCKKMNISSENSLIEHLSSIVFYVEIL